MDSGFELTSLYKIASEEVSEIERTQWPKNPNDPSERLNRIEDALKDICKKKEVGLEIVPNRRDSNRNILFIFRCGCIVASCSFDASMLLILDGAPNEIATMIFGKAWSKAGSPDIFKNLRR